MTEEEYKMSSVSHLKGLLMFVKVRDKQFLIYKNKYSKELLKVN